MIVLQDADFGPLIETILRSSFSNQREVCLSAARILVQSSLSERFVNEFVAQARTLRIGDPMDPSTDVGALISEEHRQKVEGYVALARTDGGSVVAGGRQPGGLSPTCVDGYFFEPTVITGLSDTSRVIQEEFLGQSRPFNPSKRSKKLLNEPMLPVTGYPPPFGPKV